MNHYEFLLETELARIAPLYKCAYIKIPDAIKTASSLKKRADGSVYMEEEKRPFDAILVTPNGTICVEAKANNNKLKPHQVKNGALIESINGSFVVVRVIVDNKAFKKQYKVETSDRKIIFRTEHMDQLMVFLRDEFWYIKGKD